MYSTPLLHVSELFKVPCEELAVGVLVGQHGAVQILVQLTEELKVEGIHRRPALRSVRHGLGVTITLSQVLIQELGIIGLYWSRLPIIDHISDGITPESRVSRLHLGLRTFCKVTLVYKFCDKSEFE